MTMIPFGGEAPFDQSHVSKACVHSGRAALRLLIASGLKNKKFLIPDFLCGIIVDVLKQNHVQYDYYPVKLDLTPDWAKITTKKFDVLYAIDYFGQKTSYPKGMLQKKTLIIDCVFAPLLEIPHGISQWAVFNSLRKVTPLADGAFVWASWPLRLEQIKPQPAGFVAMKYSAKQAKADYMNTQKGRQSTYVQLLSDAEKRLDQEKGICSISPLTIAQLPDMMAGISKEQLICKDHYKLLDGLLGQYRVALKPQWYSFYLIQTRHRDALRAYLAQQQIFLPAHWPCVNESTHRYYNESLSIPLGSRYTSKQLKTVAQTIKSFLSKDKSRV